MGEAIFRFLFKYPPIAFSQGRLALASSWPVWVLLAAILLVAVLLGLYLRRLRSALPTRARVLVWGLQSVALAILLVLLWRPSLILSTLVPQQNVLAVLVDDSASMAMDDQGIPRVDQVKEILADSGPLLGQLRENFQVRLYRFDKEAVRIDSVAELTASGSSSHLQDSLAQAYSELRHLPLAGVVIISDGAENGSAAPRELMEEWKARKIPVYALGVGEEEFDRDLQIDEVSTPRTALPGTVVSFGVTVRQQGYVGESARLEIRDGAEVLKSREIHFGRSPVETVQMSFTPKSEGIPEYTISIEPLAGEAVKENNSQARVVEVQDRTAKVLYIEGEPRWEFKFIRRALDEDRNLRLVSLLRTSQNKFYRQGIENEEELAEGFPDREELFRYDGLILGSIGVAFFSPEQQEDIYAFVSQRGGGLLFLGGRHALGDGGYQSSTLADLLPVQLDQPDGSPTFRRTPVQFQLTPRGWDRLQLSEDEAANRESWENLPLLGNYQVTGEPKPGAVVLGEAVAPDGKRHTLLASQRFGRGRALMFATDGSWRWQMELDHTNNSHKIFWQQILHSLVSDTPPPVSISTDKALYLDDQHVRIQAAIYDEKFQPVNAASTIATISLPDGSTVELPLQLSVEEDGVFRGEWEASAPGVYRVDVVARAGEKEIGRNSSYFQRADGSLEFFSAEQNVSLLTRLAEETGGGYYPLAEAGRLPEQLTYSPAGITVPEVRDLWDMPFWILLLFLLKGTEWILRKRWRSI